MRKNPVPSPPRIASPVDAKCILLTGNRFSMPNVHQTWPSSAPMNALKRYKKWWVTFLSIRVFSKAWRIAFLSSIFINLLRMQWEAILIRDCKNTVISIINLVVIINFNVFSTILKIWLSGLFLVTWTIALTQNIKWLFTEAFIKGLFIVTTFNYIKYSLFCKVHIFFLGRIRKIKIHLWMRLKNHLLYTCLLVLHTNRHAEKLYKAIFPSAAITNMTRYEFAIGK